MAAERRARKGRANRLFERLPAPWDGRLRVLGRIGADRGLTLALVGGCVRDVILRRVPLDWDVVVAGPAAGLVQEAAKTFAAGVIQHPAFLTYTLVFPDGTSLDVATARRETYPHPASLPVVEPAGFSEDFARRDFPVNAVAAHIAPDRWGHVEDPFDGRGDIARGVVRVLHDRSFEDDPTRVHRAARYAGRYGWRVEPKTRRLALESVRGRGPALVSPARLRVELEKCLSEEDPRPALRLLWSWGAWTFWNGAWSWNPFLTRALRPFRAGTAAQPDPVLLRLMILCRFQAPAEAQTSLRRLEFPRFTAEAVGRALRLREALSSRDVASLEAHSADPTRGAFLRLALDEPALLARWERSNPLLTGDDLQDLGYRPGPAYQDIFAALRRARWDGRPRTRDQEIRFVIDNFPRKN